jgi:hypothetical protein
MNQKELEAWKAEVTLAIQSLNERVEELEGGKSRGPKAERPMTDADAYRVKFGDMNPKLLKHKPAAETLGLSYGQVFSCRNGYTFKHVKEDGSWNPDGTKKEKPAGQVAAVAK